MTIQMTRRTAVATALAAGLPSMPARSGQDDETHDHATRFAAIEREAGGRFGLAALDLASGRSATYRGGEPFPLCSTFKLLAASLVLARVDRGGERLERRIVFTPAEVVTYSPVTGPRAGPDGMTLAEICHAAITRSDNTAGNLMLASFGGPAALTTFLRGLGDRASRLDRIEPDLNEALPGDPRDTTTPAAMLGTTRRLLAGDALAPASREILSGWLVANTTGAARIRAGAPAGWRIGDKTGTGERGAVGDVAILWPPSGAAPILVAVYGAGSDRAPAELSRAIAEMARAALDALGIAR